MAYCLGLYRGQIRQRPKSAAYTRSRSALRVQAASPTPVQERVELPLQLQRLLQVNQAASRETCSRVIEKLSSSPPAVGYSKGAIASRERILGEVGRTLSDAHNKAGALAGPAASIAYSDIPGALTLLHEAGDMQSVLSWGQAWLREHPHGNLASDAALAVALAHCDLAAARLDSSAADVLACINEMQLAESLLQEYQAGAVLQQDIQKALEELAPQAALQQLALPLEDPLRQQRGIQTLHSILWRKGQPVWEFPSLHMDRSAFLQEASSFMTASEQVVMFESAPEGAPVPGDELYQVALAHIVEGLQTFSPARLTAADKMLSFLAAQPREDGDREVSVEIAVCKLLLGDTDAAEAALGLSPQSQHQPDPDIVHFIQGFCPDGGDAVPGLVALAQQWLAEVVWPSFRSCGSSCPSLQGWFDHPRVSLQLQVRRKAQDLGLSEARNSLSAAAQAVTGAVASKWSALMGQPAAHSGPMPSLPMQQEPALQASPPSAQRPSEGSSDRTRAENLDMSPQAAGMSKARQRQRAQLQEALDQQAAVQLSDVQEETVGSLQKRLAGMTSTSAEQEDEHGESPPDQQQEEPAARAGQGQASSKPLPAAAVAGGKPGRANNRTGQAAEGGGLPPMTSAALVSGIRMLPGEREMWSSISPAAKRRRRVRAWLACVTVLGVGVLAYRSWSARAALPGAQVPAWSFVQSFWEPAAASEESISKAQALRIVQRWQTAKAAALGDRHNQHGLTTILTGPLLQQWQDATESLEAQQQHWALSLRHIDLTSAEVLEAGGSARLRATVHETARLLDQAGEVEETMDAPVVIEYELAWQPGQGWLIADLKEIS